MEVTEDFASVFGHEHDVRMKEVGGVAVLMILHTDSLKSQFALYYQR
jgi:hypothetical protein